MLSKKTKYAIKALLFLHTNYKDTPAPTKVIATAEKIPYKFLENILRELKQHKILKSERGSGGGYLFLKDPKTVSIAEIIRITDGPIAHISCISKFFYQKCNECIDEKECKIRKLFSHVLNEILPILDKSIDTLSKL